MTKYGNWFPKWFFKTIIFGLFILLGLSLFFTLKEYKVTSIVFIIITVLYLWFCLKIKNMYKEFDLDNEDSVSWQIIKYVASYVKVSPNQKILDIGCGSGALSIECAKRNKDSFIVGMDRWGKEYKDFSKQICQQNAREEKVDNISFEKGDIKDLPFEKESFDCITSNYVIHNVSGDKIEMIINILDLLKKDGSFAIHDLFSKVNYGDLDLLVKKLKTLGYKKVELITTTEDSSISYKKAKSLMLQSSKLLYGIK